MTMPFPGNTKKEAFRQFYEEYYAPFCLYADRFVHDRDVREDIVSEVFAMLWHKVETGVLELRKDTAVAYVKMCVRNSCLNWLKHKEYESGFAESVKVSAPVYEEEPDSVYTLEELYRMLYEALDRLPENYRATFVAGFFAGKTQAEIAQEMNISVKSVGRYRQKALDLLKDALRDILPVILLVLSQK